MSAASGPALGSVDQEHANHDTCTVCPHPWPDHDALGRRFCTATQTAALTRGCICTPPTRRPG